MKRQTERIISNDIRLLNQLSACRITGQLSASVFQISEQDIFAKTRGCSHVAFARQVAMYLAHVVCGLTLTSVGKLFGRDRTTVSHACAVVEDRRDNEQIDLVLDFLERSVLRQADRCV